MKTITPPLDGPVCPLPLTHHDQIVLGHGSGGKMTHDLIAKVFRPPLSNPALDAGDDAAVVQVCNVAPNQAPLRLAVSTDSHVVWPLFFAGGDIGRLAVCGTVNDLAMMGAKPLYLTAGFVIEEGLDIAVLQQVVTSMQAAAQEARVQIVAGDTKVVQKGKADKLFINTSGIGSINTDIHINGSNAQPGDIVIVSGTLGDHGIAVLEARGELGFETNIQSDVAPLNHLVEAILSVSHQIHVLRDPTRGGLATSLNEIAAQSQVGILLEENQIPVHPTTAAACEMLGFDPLYVANEGKLIAIVGPDDAQVVLDAMRATLYGAGAAIIGEVGSHHPGRVLLKTAIGGTRIVDVLAGEMLPRIC